MKRTIRRTLGVVCCVLSVVHLSVGVVLLFYPSVYMECPWWFGCWPF